VRLAVSLMIRRNLRYSDSRRKGVAYSALEPKLFSKCFSATTATPYLPGTTVRRRRLDWAEDHWCAWGSRASSRRALSNGNARRPHSWRQYLRRRSAPANRKTGFFCGLGRPLYFCVAYTRAGIGRNIPL
jgi:hypothetical protein